ncbi:MAG: M28 family peptidase [Chloroflexota bacterium]
MLENYLQRVAQPDLIKRREGLLSSLKGIGAPYDILKVPVGNHNLVNVSVPMHHDEMPYILIATNYDSVEGSIGANNNGASVAILLSILRVFHFIRGRKKQALPLEFAFFDGHHEHMVGGRSFAEAIYPENIHLMINLDLCGIGDMVLLSAGHYVESSPARQALYKLNDAKHLNYRLLDLLPPSNDAPFEARGIPTISVSIAPEDDITPIVGVAVSMRNEENVALLPNVYECIHHPERDTLDIIEVDAMRQVMLIVNTLISNMLTVIKADWR